MNVIKKYFGMTVLSLITLFILSSCTSKKEDAKTLKVWHFWSEPNQKEVLKSLIAEFEKANGCKVELTDLSWNDGKTKLTAAFNSKTAPDVLELGSDWVAQFSSAGVLAELNSDTMQMSKFVDYSIAPGKWDNKFYAVPWIIDTRVLFFNKTLLRSFGLPEEAPVSFDKLLEYADRINGSEGKYGFGANGSDPHRLYKKIVPMFWTYGGSIIDSAGNFTINSPQNIAALNMYANLSRVGIIETQRQIDAAFVQGKVAFWFSGGWLIEKIMNENPALEFGVANMPGINGNPGISFAGGEYLAVSKMSKKKTLAEKFIKFMTDGKNSINFCKKVSEAGFPADAKYFADSWFAQNQYKSVFAKQLEVSKMTPVHPKWLDIEALIENATVETLYGKADASAALNNAQQEALNLK